MQTNILGPKDAPYVNILTDLDELTKKETAILLACVQGYYEETIHRLGLALSEPHGEDELAFLAAILTQFYHKSGSPMPEILLKIANMEVEIVDQTTDIIVDFFLQVDKGFRGLTVDGISKSVQDAVEKRLVKVAQDFEGLASNELDHMKLAILADELYDEGSFKLAVRMFKLAEEVNSTHQFIDYKKWENGKIFDDAFEVGSIINAANKDLPEHERELINQLYTADSVHHLEVKKRLSIQKLERQREAEEKRMEAQSGK